MRMLKMLSVLCMAVLVCGEASAVPVDRIVAVVNEEVITLSDLNTLFEQYRKMVEASYRGPDLEKVLSEARRSLLNRLIDDSLLDQEAKKTGITVRDEEVVDAISDVRKRKNMSMEDFIKAVVKEGGSFDVYKKEMRSQIMKMKLVRRELKSKLMVGDEEIGDYYRKHRGDYEGKEAVRIKQILLLLPNGASAQTRARIQGDAAGLLKRLKDGEAFEQLAAAYSQGPVAAAGGDMGYLEKGLILPAVEQAAFSLGINEISEVIESPIGFHIIKVTDKRGAGLKPLEHVREEIRAKIEEEKLEKKFEEWMGDLRKRSHIEIK